MQHITKGRIKGITSNLVTVAVDGPVSQNEICHILLDDVKLMAEVIKVVGDLAYVQVFESTRGLKSGMEVEFDNHLLEVTLAPGILTRIYDGLQNDLASMNTLFLERGTVSYPIDFEALWDFTPLAKVGDKVSAASWLGSVPETVIEHKIMVPFKMTGDYTIKTIAPKGKYKVTDTIATVTD
ncbi:MAG: V-type ATP synthase subunit A, partial [Rikenellaceae bacterium]